MLSPWFLQNSAYCRARSVYVSARIRPPPPQGSLPRPQKGTRHGSSPPFARRSSTIGEVPERVRYSTHSLISRTVPEPTRQAETSYAVFCLKKKKTKRQPGVNTTPQAT